MAKQSTSRIWNTFNVFVTITANPKNVFFCIYYIQKTMKTHKFYPIIILSFLFAQAIIGQNTNKSRRMAGNWYIMVVIIPCSFSPIHGIYVQDIKKKVEKKLIGD